jgi:ABC-type dipeptide/oligopeptide/nickel transport system permease component
MKKWLERGFWLLLLVYLVFASSKLLIRFIPGDPVDVIMAETGAIVDRDTLAKEMGLDQAFIPSLIHQSKDALRGDFGYSLFQKKPILEILKPRLINSAWLAILALLTGLSIATTLAVFSSLPSRFQIFWDRAQNLHSVWVASLPTAWIAPVFAYVFAVHFKLFPLGGSLWLPALTLGYCLSGFWTRALRETLRGQLTREHVRAARARGLGELTILFRYGLYPALGPWIAYLGTQTGLLFAGAIIVESVFDWPGLGSLLIESIFKRDYPLIEMTLFVSSTLILMGNLLGDMIQEMISPRLRETS